MYDKWFNHVFLMYFSKNRLSALLFFRFLILGQLMHGAKRIQHIAFAVEITHAETQRALAAGTDRIVGQGGTVQAWAAGDAIFTIQ